MSDPELSPAINSPLPTAHMRQGAEISRKDGERFIVVANRAILDQALRY